MKLKSPSIISIQLFAVLLLIVVFSIQTSSLTFSQDECFKIEEQIKNVMETSEIDNLAATVIVDEDPFWSFSEGGINHDTVFAIGSLTKVFTSLAIFSLVADNQLNLTSDINTYLPFNVTNPNYPQTSITTQHLLTHTASLVRDSGLVYGDFPMYVDLVNPALSPDPLNVSYPEWIPEYYAEEGDYYNTTVWADRSPGDITSSNEYANAGFSLLGYLIEQVSGLPYYEYLKINLLDPLNLNNTYYDFNDVAPESYSTGQNFSGDDMPAFNLNERGAGSLKSSVNDLSKLLTHLVAPSSELTEIVPNTSLSFMMEDYLGFLSTGTRSYGHGWQLLERNGLWGGHSGSIAGATTNMFFKESDDGPIGVILMIDRLSSDFSTIRNLLFDATIDLDSFTEICETETSTSDENGAFYLSGVATIPVLLILVYTKKKTRFV